MRAKVIATDASTETGLCHFTFETTMKEAATIGSFSPDDEFYIEKSAKNVATFPGKVVGMLDGNKSISCQSDDVFAALKGLEAADGADVTLICIVSE